MCREVGETFCPFPPITKRRNTKGLLWVKGLLEITLCSSSICVPLSVLSWVLDYNLASGKIFCNSYPLVLVLNNVRTNWLMRQKNYFSPGWRCDSLRMHSPICPWDTWKSCFALLLCLSLYRESGFSHSKFHLLGTPGGVGRNERGERSCSVFQMH